MPPWVEANCIRRVCETVLLGFQLYILNEAPGLIIPEMTPALIPSISLSARTSADWRRGQQATTGRASSLPASLLTPPSPTFSKGKIAFSSSKWVGSTHTTRQARRRRRVHARCLGCQGTQETPPLAHLVPRCPLGSSFYVSLGGNGTKFLIKSSHQAISCRRENFPSLESEAEEVLHFQEHILSILYQIAH